MVQGVVALSLLLTSFAVSAGLREDATALLFPESINSCPILFKSEASAAAVPKPWDPSHVQDLIDGYAQILKRYDVGFVITHTTPEASYDPQASVVSLNPKFIDQANSLKSNIGLRRVLRHESDHASTELEFFKGKVSLWMSRVVPSQEGNILVAHYGVNELLIVTRDVRQLLFELRRLCGSDSNLFMFLRLQSKSSLANLGHYSAHLLRMLSQREKPIKETFEPWTRRRTLSFSNGILGFYVPTEQSNIIDYQQAMLDKLEAVAKLANSASLDLWDDVHKLPFRPSISDRSKVDNLIQRVNAFIQELEGFE